MNQGKVPQFQIQQQQDFCWQSKSARRWIREHFKGLQARNLLAVYDGLTELASEARSHTGCWSSPEIQAVSCVDKNAMPGCLQSLEDAGLIQREQVRTGGRTQVTKITLLTHGDAQPKSGFRISAPEPKSGIGSSARTPKSGFRTQDTSAGAIQSHTPHPESGFRTPQPPPPTPPTPAEITSGKGGDQTAKGNAKDKSLIAPPPPIASHFRFLPENAEDFNAVRRASRYGRDFADTEPNAREMRRASKVFGSELIPSLKAFLASEQKFLLETGHLLKTFADQPDTWLPKGQALKARAIERAQRDDEDQAGDQQAAAQLERQHQEIFNAFNKLTPEGQQLLEARAAADKFIADEMRKRRGQALTAHDPRFMGIRDAWTEFPAPPVAKPESFQEDAHA